VSSNNREQLWHRVAISTLAGAASGGCNTPGHIVAKAFQIADEYVAALDRREEERLEREEQERAKAVAAIVPGRLYQHFGDVLEVKEISGNCVRFTDGMLEDIDRVLNGHGYVALDDEHGRAAE
jgi:hypothetical protein